MKESLKEYINSNMKIIIVIAVCVACGILIGLTLYKFITPEIRADLVNTMKTTLDLTKQENFEGINIIKNGTVSNMILVFIIYAISLTLISPYMISVLSIFKGISIGIYIPTIFQIFGASKGILALILLVIIPNLAYIPSYIFLCTNAIKFHTSLIADGNKLTIVIKELMKITIGFSIMFMGVVLEQLTSYWIISIYKSI